MVFKLAALFEMEGKPLLINLHVKLSLMPPISLATHILILFVNSSIISFIQVVFLSTYSFATERYMVP